MGCYGIGVSRIVAAAIEQNHDDKGIIWPAAIAPFQLAIVPLNMHKSEAVAECALEMYETLSAQGIDVLLDDRNERPGVKFNDAELVGIPYRVTVGPRGLADEVVEINQRATGNTLTVPLQDAVADLVGRIEAARRV